MLISLLAVASTDHNALQPQDTYFKRALILYFSILFISFILFITIVISLHSNQMQQCSHISANLLCWEMPWITNYRRMRHGTVIITCHYKITQIDDNIGAPENGVFLKVVSGGKKMSL